MTFPWSGLSLPPKPFALRFSCRSGNRARVLRPHCISNHAFCSGFPAKRNIALGRATAFPHNNFVPPVIRASGGRWALVDRVAIGKAAIRAR